MTRKEFDTITRKNYNTKNPLKDSQSSINNMTVTDNEAAKKVEYNKKLLFNGLIVSSSIGAAAGIGAVVYNIKTGGGFWRGVGYFLLAGVLIGFPARLITSAVVAKKLKK